MADFLIFLSIIIFLIAAIAAIFRTKLKFEPFSLSCMGFALCGIFWALHIFHPSVAYDDSLELWVAVYILSFSVFTLIVNTLFLGPTNLDHIRRIFHAFSPPFWLFVALSIPVVVYGFLLLHQNGWVPPILTQNAVASSGSGISRADYEVPFIGEFALGCYRAILLLFTIDFLNKKLPIYQYYRHRFKITCIVLAIPLVYVLIGRRNPASWCLFTILYTLALSGRLKFKTLLIVALGFSILFVLVGQFRRGGRNYEDCLAYKTGIQSIDSGLSWFSAYLAPTYVNLNSFFEADYPPKDGAFWVSRLVPGPIYSLFATKPDDAATRMVDDGSFQYPAMTFYTIFADFGFDFGPAGAWIIVCLIYLSMALLASHNNGRIMTALFLNFSSSLIQMFAVNRFMGMTNFLGLFFVAISFYLIRTRARGKFAYLQRQVSAGL